MCCSVEQLKDLGCKWVILGHSERRHIIGEDDQVNVMKLSGSQEISVQADSLQR